MSVKRKILLAGVLLALAVCLVCGLIGLADLFLPSLVEAYLVLWWLP